MRFAALLIACTVPTGTHPIRPTMIVWNTGLVETITTAKLGEHTTWRITHYPQDPTASAVQDYDLYDLDSATLAPLRSVMHNEQLHLELMFTPREVMLRRVSGPDSAVEHIPLSGAVRPEGPGTDVFVASLPISVGYTLHYSIVDRWHGQGATRVKAVTLTVPRPNEVLIRADDGSFQIRERVRAERPHWPLRVEYTRDGKTYPASEVVATTAMCP